MSRTYESIGELIRDALLMKEECHGSELHRIVQEEQERKISLESFRKNYLYKMEKLGLIQRSSVGKRPVPHLKPRQYWKIVPEKKSLIELWRSPQTRYEREFRRKKE